MAAMYMFSKKHDVMLTWNFSATSHGKGPVDGVGATLKRIAMEKVQTRKVVVNNADDFYHAVKDGNIKVTMMNTTELQKYSNKYLETLFSNTTSIPGISCYHYVEPSKKGYILKRYSSKVDALDFEEESDTGNCHDMDDEPTPSFQVKAGNWYAFFLEKYRYWYIGLVLEAQNKDQVKVDFLQQLSQAKNCFDRKDEVEVVLTKSAFYALRSEPSPISSTRTNHLKHDDSEFEEILKLNDELC